MLTNCPECKLQVSDRAVTCPHCGFPLKPSPQARKRSHMRLPNGFGQITELKNRNLRKPFRVMVTVGKNLQGKPICKLLKPEAYFKTYNDAYTALVEYNRNPYELATSITLAELYELWLSDKQRKISNENTIETYATAWKQCQTIADMEVIEIRPRHIRACLDQASTEMMASKAHSILNMMFDYAVEHELVTHNYSRDVKQATPKTKKNAHMAFTDEEIETLWKYQSMPYVCYILLQTYMGWRPQELCDLKKENIDWDKLTITGGMKTDAGVDRRVPIHKDLVPILKKIKGVSDSLGSEYVCPTLNGLKLTYTNYRNIFTRTMGEIGMSERHKPHDPRKTFVTIAKAEEVNDFAIKYIVGHAIGDVTEKIYTERDVGWLRTELEKIKIPSARN